MIKEFCVGAAKEIKNSEASSVEVVGKQEVVEAGSKGEKQVVEASSVVEANQDDKNHATDSTKPGIILLDLCCGTGTIGISLASHVKQVIGVEMNSEAIKDAERNAQLNNIQNATYYTSKIEDISYKLFKNIDPKDTVIAVLDPPRTGVHYSVIRSIRDTPKLKHLIFVACE